MAHILDVQELAEYARHGVKVINVQLHRCCGSKQINDRINGSLHLIPKEDVQS